MKFSSYSLITDLRNYTAVPGESCFSAIPNADDFVGVSMITRQARRICIKYSTATSLAFKQPYPDKEVAMSCWNPSCGVQSQPYPHAVDRESSSGIPNFCFCARPSDNSGSAGVVARDQPLQ